MSSSRGGGSGETCWARSISSSVVSPMAEMTTTTSFPAFLVATIRWATRLMPSASATEEPPYLCTTRPTVVVSSNHWLRYAVRRCTRRSLGLHSSRDTIVAYPLTSSRAACPADPDPAGRFNGRVRHAPQTFRGTICQGGLGNLLGLMSIGAWSGRRVGERQSAATEEQRHEEDHRRPVHLPRRGRRGASRVALPVLQRRDGRRGQLDLGGVRHHAAGP